MNNHKLEGILCPNLNDKGYKVLKNDFEKLAFHLKNKANGNPIILLQNVGNYGDGLIRAGTLEFFKAYDIEWIELDMFSRVDKLKAAIHAVSNRFYKRPLLVYSGSGAWSSYTSLGKRNVSLLNALGGDCFVLPTTFEDVVNLKEVRFTAFVRDKYESKEALPNANFCHDMAFFLAVLSIKSKSKNNNQPNLKSPEKLLCFRVDNESRGHGFDALPNNRDLSNEGNHQDDIYQFLSVINQYDTIVTDRLHVAIGGVLLGKQVKMALGNYFKILSIYKSSINGNFHDVTLLRTDQEIEKAILE